MIRSMTAFARQEKVETWGSLVLELRSVNHRYLELAMRLPDELRAHEGRLREWIQQQLNRGKVDCVVRYQPAAIGSNELKVNAELVKHLVEACNTVTEMFVEHRPVSPLEVLRWPEVLQTPHVDPDVLQQTLQQLVSQALKELLAMRQREGDKLSQIILQRLDAMQHIVAQVREVLPQIRQQFRDKLQLRLAEVKVEVNSDRVEQELVLLAQKMDVDEELDRLTTHIGEVRHVLASKDPVGRRLDFLMQELNREANTLGSKSIDIRTTNASVDLKVLIEQMREQVQNIE